MLLFEPCHSIAYILFYHVKKPWVKQYSIMLGLICGWILFALFGEAPVVHLGKAGSLFLPYLILEGRILIPAPSQPVYSSGFY